MNKNKSSFRPLFWIPIIYNGFTLIVTLVVGVTFLIGSQTSSSAEVNLPGIILGFFTAFDLLLMVSPLMLVVMVLISIFNLMKENTKFRRFMPLVMSTILQGLLSALFVSTITQPVA